MIDSTYFEPNRTDTSVSTRRTRSAIACNGCRKLKMKVRTCYAIATLPWRFQPQCANINRERCERCKEKNIVCEYSFTRSGQANSSQNTPKLQASIDTPIKDGMYTHQSAVSQATAATHGGQSVSLTAANRREDITYAPSNVTGCSWV
jgi:hypothetical protein